MRQQFSKDGRVTTVTSPAQAVRLRFDGWQPITVTSDPEPDSDTTTETPSEVTADPDTPSAPAKRTARRK